MAIFSADPIRPEIGEDDSPLFLLSVSRNESSLSASDLFYAPKPSLLDIEDYLFELEDGFRSEDVLQVIYISNLTSLTPSGSSLGFKMKGEAIALDELVHVLATASRYRHLLLTNTQDRKLLEELEQISIPSNISIFVSYAAAATSDFVSLTAVQYYRALALPARATYRYISADKFIDSMAALQQDAPGEARVIKGWRETDRVIGGFPISAAVTNVTMLQELSLEERLAEERRQAEARLLEEERLAEERRQAEARLLEEERLAEERRQAEARLLEDEGLSVADMASQDGVATAPQVASGLSVAETPESHDEAHSLLMPDEGLDVEKMAPRDRDYLLVERGDLKIASSTQTKDVRGTCILLFTVTRTGTVADARSKSCTAGNLSTASARGSFSALREERRLRKEALATIKKFKYLPRIVDGVAVDTPDVEESVQL